MNALRTNADWCDDVRTPARETCAGFRSATLREALSLLRERLGPDPARWRWERLHRARFPHGVFESVPGLRSLFSLETGQGGDASTVNVGAYRLDGSFRMTDGPSYRQIIDLSGGGDLLMNTTGQSGNVFDPEYRDFLRPWREGSYFSPGGAPAKVLRLVAR